MNAGLKGLVFDAMMEPSNNKVNEVRKTKRAADSDAHTDAKQRKLLEPEASPTNHSLGGAAAEAANPPDRFSLVRRLSNHDRTGDAQGLFNIDFAVKEGESLRLQGDIDRELSEIWRTTKAGEISETTRETVGAKYDVLSSDRFNIRKERQTRSQGSMSLPVARISLWCWTAF